MELRPYQIEAINQLRSRLVQGKKRLVLQMTTGGGKTVVAAELIRLALERGKRVLFLAHRRELVKQCSDKLTKFGVHHQIIMVGEPGTGPLMVAMSNPIQVASKDTLWARAVRSTKLDLPPADLVIADECFPAGTMIGVVPIEELEVGDAVECFNHSKNCTEIRRVPRIFTKTTDCLVKIRLSNGQEVACTPNHPFFTLRGYVSAAMLRSDDMVLSTTHSHGGMDVQENVQGMSQGVSRHQQHDTWRDLLPGVQDGLAAEELQGSGCAVSSLRQDGDDAWAASGKGPSWSMPVLSRMQGEDVSTEHGSNEPQVCVGSHEGEQSNGQGGHQSQGFNDDACNGMEANRSGRKRQASTTRTDASCLCVGVADGIPNQDQDASWVGLSDMLQGGHCERSFDGGHRTGRTQPFDTEGPSSGSKEAGVLDWVGLDGFEILQPGGDGEFERLCPEGLVYNLEVEEHHNYFANGILVHNCHHSMSRTWLDLLKKYDQATVIGLTATPSRGDGTGLGDFYEDMVQAISCNELVEQGYLVPFKVFAPYRPDLQGVKLNGGDYQKKSLELRMDKAELIGDIVEHWKQLGQNRQTIVFASGVDHSIHLARAFSEAGVKAMHVDGNTPLDERDEIMRMVMSGEIKVLTNCDVCCEGTDLPPMSCAVLARPTKSIVKYKQMVGRVMRPWEGKEYALLLDHAGCVYKHGFPDEEVPWTLDGREKIDSLYEKAKKEGKVKEPIVCKACYAVFYGKPECPSCGAVVRKNRQGKGVTTKDGFLKEVERGKEYSATPDERQRFWQRALAITANKLQALGVAAGMFSQQFGQPPWKFKECSPMPPSRDAWKKKTAEVFPGFVSKPKSVQPIAPLTQDEQGHFF